MPCVDVTTLCSDVVRPRRFLARDEALDYEAMSDQEWEAEPVEGKADYLGLRAEGSRRLIPHQAWLIRHWAAWEAGMSH